jgi:hypothetical protein
MILCDFVGLFWFTGSVTDRDVYPESGSRIKLNKRGGHKFNKIVNYLIFWTGMKKDLSQFKYFKPKKLLLSSQKYGLVPGSAKNLSRIQIKKKKHWIPDPQHWLTLPNINIGIKIDKTKIFK